MSICLVLGTEPLALEEITPFASTGVGSTYVLDFLDDFCICLILSTGSGFLSGKIGAEWLPPLGSLIGKWKTPGVLSGFNCRKIQILN
jgi:hypothetical protein